MMRSMDAMGAFSHLSDNVPSWINRVSELAAYTAAKNAEYTEAYQKHTKGKPQRKKNTSVCSIHTEDLDKPADEPEDEPTGNPLKRGIDDTASTDSNASDPMAVISTRHNVIIHYDGHTQQTLEELVRNIGTARNNIRRARMSQLPMTGFRSMRPKLNIPSLAESTDGAPVLPNIRRMRQQPPPPQKDSPFDSADKNLELAHSLCETAAYQFLRAGDCSTELSSVGGKFKILLDMANTEVERLKEEQKDEPKEEEPKEVEPASKPQETGDGAIEVDDSSDVSVESIDLSAFRKNRYRA